MLGRLEEEASVSGGISPQSRKPSRTSLNACYILDVRGRVYSSEVFAARIHYSLLGLLAGSDVVSLPSEAAMNISITLACSHRSAFGCMMSQVVIASTGHGASGHRGT